MYLIVVNTRGTFSISAHQNNPRSSAQNLRDLRGWLSCLQHVR